MKKYLFSGVNAASVNEVVATAVAAGINLIYTTLRKDGDYNITVLAFGESAFIAESTKEVSRETAVFRAWKNLVKLHWTAKEAEKQLKEDNNGISLKLRATCPSYVFVSGIDNSGEKPVRFSNMFDVTASVWSKIGLIPAKKDLEALQGLSKQDRKTRLHNAARASFDALNFRIDYDSLTVEEVTEAPESTEKAKAPKAPKAPKKAA